ncbi:MAG: CAP domain-containing protein [Treponema sp.]|nr:CAP domain-containing protein [Treponema sp.]
MKKNNAWNHKHIFSACIGAVALLLLGFSACDFQPAKNLVDGRPVGGRLAQGRPELEEYIESSTGGGSGGATIDTVQSGDKDLYPMLSKTEIKELLDKTDAKHLPNPVMEEMPNWNPNGGKWNPGKVKGEALELTLGRLNAIRKICGLYPVIMHPDNNESAQYGAALMSLSKTVGHGNQPQPAGVDPDYYEKGKKATGGGNIYQLPPEKLIAAVDGYCLDPGNPNIGHRITLLSPNQMQVGFGTVPAPPGGWGSNVLQVYDLPHKLTKEDEKKIKHDFDWNFISYPAAGYFPLEGNLFGSPAFWHVQFNGSKYTVGSGKIIVTNLGTGEQWVEEHAGGLTIIFNKSHKWRPELGTYTFEVTGVRNKTTNIPERFVFTTEFFKR